MLVSIHIEKYIYLEHKKIPVIFMLKINIFFHVLHNQVFDVVVKKGGYGTGIRKLIMM